MSSRLLPAVTPRRCIPSRRGGALRFAAFAFAFAFVLCLEFAATRVCCPPATPHHRPHTASQPHRQHQMLAKMLARLRAVKCLSHRMQSLSR
eukprot:EW706333.1.p4 GENE.EW706333.1~~EW706333.1.p4  ORF type:complete len:92 (+),score=22.14 EW706333.1:373-648(+)